MNLPAHMCLLLHVALWQYAAMEDVSNYIVDELFLPNPMNNLVVDNETNKVYVSTVNRVYQLDKNLVKEKEVITGPNNSSLTCYPLSFDTQERCELSMMNNTNKLLLIHKQMNRLIVCGSIHSGLCIARKLDDISEIEYRVEEGTESDLVVCPQEQNCDTLGLIAPGPLIGNIVLYVVSAKPEVDKYLSKSITFTTRSLAVDKSKENRLFRPVYTGGSDQSYDPVDEYKREFKYVFATDEFVYSVFQSTKGWESNAIISRICIDDPTYTSYIQMRITCFDDEKIDVNVTAAAYVKNGTFLGYTETTDLLLVTFQQGENSFLCSFTIDDINALYDETQLACFQSKGMNEDNVMIADIMETKKKNGGACTENKLTGNTTLDSNTVRADTMDAMPFYPDYRKKIGKNRCGSSYLPKEIYRKENMPVVGRILFTKPKSTFTTIITSSMHNIHDIFIGTKEGKVLQYNVVRNESYKEINLGNKVVGDLVLDASETSIPYYYVMSGDSGGPRSTANKVLRIRAAVCEQYKTCTECSGAKNPHCGWCVLDGRCIKQDTPCTGDSLLSPFDDECLAASVVKPIERTNNERVEIQVNNLPVIPNADFYECIFDDKIHVKVSSGNAIPLHCLAPNSADLPPSTPGTDFVNVKLAIRYKQTDIVSTFVEFFECSVRGVTLSLTRPCAGCITNRPNRCKWCVSKHQCVVAQNAEDICIGDTNYCPQVTSIENEDQLISVGWARQIRVHVENLPAEGSQYQCVVELGGILTKVDATKNDANLVTCQAHSYNYSLDEKELMANVGVSWRKDAVIDALPDPQVAFYKCSVGRSDCTLCVTADRKFNCGWCDALSQCTVQKHCVKGGSTNAVWITKSEQCPKPQLTFISPTSGPLKGGTLLSINGMNLGTSSSNVTSITVAGVPCDIVKEGYKVSLTVVCRTGAIGSRSTGTVAVNVRGISISSTDTFTYRNPHLGQPDRTCGPQAGGTKIVINGTDLDTGSSVEVYIGDENNKCVVQSTTFDESITCITSPAFKPIADQKIFAIYDGNYMTESSSLFTYTENPTIDSFSTLSGKLACFKSGGRTITFNGKLFESVQNPRLKLTFDPMSSKRRRRDVVFAVVDFMMRARRSISEEEYLSNCTIRNSTQMLCSTPNVSLRDDLSTDARMELLMDAYVIQLNSEISYLENPSNFSIVQEEEDEKGIIAGRLLSIRVENLNLKAVTKSEVVVMIKDAFCELQPITDESMISCKIPDKPDSASSEYPVTVTIGNFYEEIDTVSYLNYEDQGLANWVIWFIVVVCVVILVAIIVTVICCIKSKKKFNLKKNDFEKAMENMEMEVRADFRKAFAELSIDMTDLTTDVWDSGIPCLSYRVYAMNLFFPSVRYHRCMKEPDPTEKPIEVVEQGLAQFELLLNTPHFLTTFVRTLEEQHLFSNRDKGNVASLITVVLHQKLDYFTEVMKTLIADTVQAGVQKNPKLVLRRTESVAERMLSNWIAICLYPYIRDTAGKSFFLLQKAIKHQVSKGPLDAITGKARYTLSDDRLLKEDIPNDILTLFATQSNDSDDEPVIVKVLTCDSTAQVKEKVMDAMYKKIPLSQRPKAEQLDIEWRHGRGGHLILPEKDFVLEGGVSRWRRLMTIKDYKVQNNATLALVSKQQVTFPQDSPNFMNHPTVFTPMLQEEPNTKQYHLVKHSDELDAKRESTMPRDRKHVNDLYLLRLINMKGILQNYVDDVFKAILDKSSIPSAVKHFFDFLDELATKHGINDADILHIWKTNSVLGRFWVTILNNPEFVFDIDKPESVESSMSVISQTFIDACSVQEHKPTPYSPINKQLYAKEIPTYKRMVHEYYNEIKNMPSVSDQDMHAHMAEISRNHDLKFDTHIALNELWGFVNKYYEELLEALQSDSNITPQVVARLKQAYSLIDSSINNP